MLDSLIARIIRQVYVNVVSTKTKETLTVSLDSYNISQKKSVHLYLRRVMIAWRHTLCYLKPYRRSNILISRGNLICALLFWNTILQRGPRSVFILFSCVNVHLNSLLTACITVHPLYLWPISKWNSLNFHIVRLPTISIYTDLYSREIVICAIVEHTSSARCH